MKLTLVKVLAKKYQQVILYLTLCPLCLLITFANSLGQDQARQNVGAGLRSAVGNVSGYRCCLTADPGVGSSIPAQSHTFVAIDHEIISTIILFPSAESFKKGCCQLQAKVCAQITG